MSLLMKVLLAVLVFLAVSSGVTKIMLMPQDVEFFGQYGFTDPILIAFGVLHLLGGLLLLPSRTRIVGAVLVELAFLVSAALLFMAANIPMVAVTLVFVALLNFVIYKTIKSAPV